VNPIKDAIKDANKIMEIFETILGVVDRVRKEREEVRQAHALLMLLRRIAAKETAAFDLKEFNVVLPHGNINWNVRYYGIRDDSSFIIDFRPDPAVMQPKQINVNMGALKQFPNNPVIVVSGRDAHEIDQRRTARAIVEWMQKQEDELTVAYGRRERERIGR
jgi:hypothetical protein